MSSLFTDELKAKVALSGGDLKQLTADERVAYYNYVCESNGLDPLSCPFNFLEEDKKLKLYLNKGGANQLARNNYVSVKIIAREFVHNCYVVTACAYTGDRQTESIGVVPLYAQAYEWKEQNGRNFKNFIPDVFNDLQGDGRANAMMKAETKAKRRATIDLLGIGVLDETEVETMANATTLTMQQATDTAAPTPGNLQPPHGTATPQPQHGQNNGQHQQQVNTPAPQQNGQQAAPQAQQQGNNNNVQAGIQNNQQQQQNVQQQINNANQAAQQHIQGNGQQQPQQPAVSPWTRKYDTWEQLEVIIDTVRTVKDLAALHANNTHLVPDTDEFRKAKFSNRRSLILSGKVLQV